jgi:hypothetical protein
MFKFEKRKMRDTMQCSEIVTLLYARAFNFDIPYDLKDADENLLGVVFPCMIDGDRHLKFSPLVFSDFLIKLDENNI